MGPLPEWAGPEGLAEERAAERRAEGRVDEEMTVQAAEPVEAKAQVWQRPGVGSHGRFGVARAYQARGGHSPGA